MLLEAPLKERYLHYNCSCGPHWKQST